MRKAPESNKKYFFTIAIAVLIVVALFFLRNSQINEAAVDNRIGPQEQVIGVEINGATKAYIFGATDLVNDVVGGMPILVTQNGVYERRINGRVLEFTLENDRIFDSNGREWSKDGTSSAGILNKINSPIVPWYIWLSWHKDTEIYK